MSKIKSTKTVCSCLPIAYCYEGNYYLILNDCPIHKGNLELCDCVATSKKCFEGNYYLIRFDCPVHQGTLKQGHAE